MPKIQRALLSVSDKTGLIDFAKVLVAANVELISTGGTAKAVCDLVEGLGGIVVGLVFVVELEFLPGRAKLEGYDVRSLIKYQS